MTVANKEMLDMLLASEGLDNQAKDFAKLMTALSYWSMSDLDVSKFGHDAQSWHAGLGEFYTHMKFAKPLLRMLDVLVASMVSGSIASAKDDDTFNEAGKLLALYDPKFQVATEIKADTIRIIQQNAQFWRNGSNVAYKFLQKNATKIYNAFGKDMVDEALPSQLTDAHKLVDTIEKLTGRRDMKMTEEEKEKFRKSHPEDYQTVLSSRKNILEVAKQWLRMYCRKKGGLVKYSQMLEAYKEAYIFHDWPKAEDWDGWIDEDGKLYELKSKVEIKGKPGFTITGNPEYSPRTNDTFVFSCVTSMGNKQYFYRVDALTQWREERFEAVDDFVPMVLDVRKKWVADIKHTGKIQKLAVLLELMYWASARIGGEKNNVRGEKTFGMSNIRGRHVYKEGQNLVIDYLGKMAHRQKHVLTPKTPEQKLCAKLVLEWATEAGNDGVVFDLKGDYTTAPSNQTVNTYFKSKGATVSVHKLRHARATAIMERQIDDRKVCPYFMVKNGVRTLVAAKKPVQKEAETLYLKMATEVGRELGHTSGEKTTPMTAVNAYINPTTTTGFFEQLSLRLPSWAQKFADD